MPKFEVDYQLTTLIYLPLTLVLSDKGREEGGRTQNSKFKAYS